MKHRTSVSVCGALAAISVAAILPSALAIEVKTGSITTVDPTATSYGALRFKDFTNTKDGNDAGNLYLQDKGGWLGSNPGSDGRPRVQDSPHWVAGGPNSFSFEYRPVAGTTDLILAQAANMTTPASRVIDDPAASVNFISFWIHNTPLSDTVTPDTIGLTLTDLDGNLLSPADLSVSSSGILVPGGDYNWYLTDPTLLANGFILTGSVNLTTGVDAGEADKIDIAFGKATFAVPDGGATLAMLGFGLAGVAGLRRQFAK